MSDEEPCGYTWFPRSSFGAYRYVVSCNKIAGHEDDEHAFDYGSGRAVCIVTKEQSGT